MESTVDCQHFLYRHNPFCKRRGFAFPRSVNRRTYALLVILLSFSMFFTHVGAYTMACDANYEGTLSDKLRWSESVVRGKIVKVRDSSLTVRVLNVYLGDNSTERQVIDVDILQPEQGQLETGVTNSTCMRTASKGGKYILFLRRPDMSEESSNFDLLYDGLSATRDTSRTVRQLSEQLMYEMQLQEFVTTLTMETQSDAEHYAACDEATHGSYCLNGGTCVHIVALDSASCTCAADYWGDRCQRFMYRSTGLFQDDPTPAIILGCMSAFILLLCIVVAIVYIRNRKTLPNNRDVELSRDEEALQLHEERETDSNQNTQLQLQELPKEKQVGYTRISADSMATPSKDQNGASVEEVTPLNTNCNRTTPLVLTTDTLYYPKQSTV